MNRRSIIALLGLGAIGLGTAMWLGIAPNPPAEGSQGSVTAMRGTPLVAEAGLDSTGSSPESGSTPPEAASGTVVASEDEVECIDPTALWIMNRTRAETAQLKHWLESEGFFGEVSDFIHGGQLFTDEGIYHFDDYASYSTESLRALHENSNDDKALLALADRLRRNGDHAEARELYREAVIRGYTWPLIALGMIPRAVETNREQALADMFVETNRESWARLYLYQRRNGPAADFHLAISEHIIGPMAERYGPDVMDRLLETARERADELYAEFEAERLSRGLPPFDNSGPAIAEKFERDIATLTEALRSGTPKCGEE